MDKQDVVYIKCGIYTMEYFLALKRKKILTHATIWKNLEDIMLSEISQSHKDKYSMISPI